MYNLIEYSDNYSKRSGILWQYCSDELDDNITDSTSVKFTPRFTNNTGNDGTVDVKIAVPLKYLSHLWKTLEMLLINCEINLTLI